MNNRPDRDDDFDRYGQDPYYDQDRYDLGPYGQRDRNWGGRNYGGGSNPGNNFGGVSNGERNYGGGSNPGNNFRDRYANNYGEPNRYERVNEGYYGQRNDNQRQYYRPGSSDQENYGRRDYYTGGRGGGSWSRSEPDRWQEGRDNWGQGTMRPGYGTPQHRDMSQRSQGGGNRQPNQDDIQGRGNWNRGQNWNEGNHGGQRTLEYSARDWNPRANQNENGNQRGMRSDEWNQPGPFAGMGPRGYQRSDDRIKDDIHDRLTNHGNLDASDINVDVNNGDVTLSGSVSDRRQKRLAADIADSVPGVRDVNNNIKLKQNENVFEKIGDALS